MRYLDLFSLGCEHGPLEEEGGMRKRARNILVFQSILPLWHHKGFPGGSYSKESTCNAGDPGSIPGSGRCPGGGNGNPLQYSCLENPVDEGDWQATDHKVTKSWTQLSDFTFSFFLSFFLSFFGILVERGGEESLESHTWLDGLLLCGGPTFQREKVRGSQKINPPL